MFGEVELADVDDLFKSFKIRIRQHVDSGHVVFANEVLFDDIQGGLTTSLGGQNMGIIGRGTNKRGGSCSGSGSQGLPQGKWGHPAEGWNLPYCGNNLAGVEGWPWGFGDVVRDLGAIIVVRFQAKVI
jgi:hypothetical protein